MYSAVLGPDSLLLLWTKLPNNWTSYQPWGTWEAPAQERSVTQKSNFPSVFIKCVQYRVVGNVPYSSLSAELLLWMNEGYDYTAAWAGKKKKCIELFLFWTGKVDCRCVEFPFQRDADCVANEQATGFDKKKEKNERSNIKRSCRQKEKKRWSVYWLYNGAFSILITHAGRAEEMEGVTSLTAHCSLCFFDIRLLNYIFKSNINSEALLWDTMTTCCFQHNNNNKKKKKKRVVVTLADHVLSVL